MTDTKRQNHTDWHDAPSMTTAIRFPEIEVQLTGTDGNAFAIIGKVSKALRRGGASAEEVEAFTDEATSGDYDHVLQTAMRWVDVS